MFPCRPAFFSSNYPNCGKIFKRDSCVTSHPLSVRLDKVRRHIQPNKVVAYDCAQKNASYERLVIAVDSIKIKFRKL